MVDRKSTILVLSLLWKPLPIRMNAALRFAGLISSGIALLCSTTLAATAAGAASVTTSVNANNVKPLVIAKLTDLDLGSVTLGPGSWTSATVSISQAGVLACTNA